LGKKSKQKCSNVKLKKKTLRGHAKCQYQELGITKLSQKLIRKKVKNINLEHCSNQTDHQACSCIMVPVQGIDAHNKWP